MKTKGIGAVQTTVSTDWRTSKEAGESQPSEILVPIDFSKSSVNALRLAIKMVVNEKARLRLLNVIGEPASFRELNLARQQRARRQESAGKLQKLARREIGPGVDASVVVCEGNPSRAIARLAERHQSSLIVVTRHEHRGFARWSHGNIVKSLVNTSPCPVMVLADN